MFIYLEDSRDMMAFQHDRLKKEFWLDAETTVKSGKVALATLNDDETYTMKPNRHQNLLGFQGQSFVEPSLH